jgi:hypothetical protein
MSAAVRDRRPGPTALAPQAGVVAVVAGGQRAGTAP